MMIKKTFFLLLALYLSGCASTKPSLPETFSHAAIPQDKGVIVGSFTKHSDAHVYNGYSFGFKKIGDSEESSGTIFVTTDEGGLSLKFPSDISEPKAHGTPFFFTLPAGEYEFYDFYIFSSGLNSEKSWSANKPYSVRFTVNPGKTSYVGEIRNYSIKGENIFGMEIPAGVVFSILNNSNRDLVFFEQKYPDFDWESVIIDVPNSGIGTEGLIYFRELEYDELGRLD